MRQYFFLPALFFFISITAQPSKPGSAAIYNKIKKLNFLGSVLYIAAHPDDENTRLIAYLANDRKARTGYLSLTRGDGGQNLIGPELREQLGVIRTQELLEARKIDGGEQFFTRANDFGYSKNPDETLQIWQREQVLSDMVRVIRKFRPDVIINRFDARTPGSTHGHHTASAILSLEAFEKAADTKAFPDLKALPVHQPTRLYMNTSWWFYGSREKFEKADKSKLIQIETGSFYATLGKSNQEIAALSRSCHRSQGFGSMGARGSDTEYLEFLKGKPTKSNDLFEGIDTSWNRVKGGAEIKRILNRVEKDFDFTNPSASLPDLILAYRLIQKLEDEHWRNQKSEEIKVIIAACSGLFLEAVSSSSAATPGSEIMLKLEAINRSPENLKLAKVAIAPAAANSIQNVTLAPNALHTFDVPLRLPLSTTFTQPYWLTQPGTLGMYWVQHPQNIGEPDVIREIKAVFYIELFGETLNFERNVIFKRTDDIKGEIYEPFDIVPAVTLSVLEKVLLFNNSDAKNFTVQVQAGKDQINGTVQLENLPGWTITPKSQPFSLLRKGETALVEFQIMANASAKTTEIKATAIIDGVAFDREQRSISYDHIPKQQILRPASAKLIYSDLKTEKHKIAYIMGAGDEVPQSLRQMGYEVVLLTPNEITADRLLNFDVVMTGIRAYNVVKELEHKQELLLEFVHQGKTMIVQYNTLDDLVTGKMSPFALKLSRDRVTEENCKVTLLNESHRLLNYPNKITSEDFNYWKQERGLYFPSSWDAAFTPILSMNDQGESAKNGALLVAPYGKGTYIYTGLSFFRELPEGVPGAFRLMANLISATNLKTN